MTSYFSLFGLILNFSMSFGMHTSKCALPFSVHCLGTRLSMSCPLFQTFNISPNCVLQMLHGASLQPAINQWCVRWHCLSTVADSPETEFAVCQTPIFSSSVSSDPVSLSWSLPYILHTKLTYILLVESFNTSWNSDKMKWKLVTKYAAVFNFLSCKWTCQSR